ncbi:phage portal protein [Spirillospora sp. NBC_00431]
MGLIRSAARALVGPVSGIATPEKWVEDWFRGGVVNSAGVRVDYETALHYSAFFAGVRVIAEDVGSLPFPLYERMEPRGKRRAIDHPLYELLRNQPNPMMSSQQLRETLMGHALMWGDGVAQVVSDRRTGVIEEIWPLRPDRLRIKILRTGPGAFTRVYQYRDEANGIKATLFPDEVLHIAGLGFNGVHGYSVVEHAANSIGLGLATEHHGAKYFSNGSAPAGALTHPGNLSDGARKRMADDWENIHRGIDRAHRVAILEEGVTWQQVGISNEDAQFLETRKLQVTEMARWLRIPAHKISDLERATFSNIEELQIDYVSSALRAWLERWEQAVYTQLLIPEERERFFAEHIVDALLRGNTKARYDAYAVGRQWGWLSANDVREKENENPVDGGDAYLVPLNMVPAGQPAPARGAGARALRARVRGAAMRERLAGQYGPMIERADAEIAALEAKEVGRLVEEHLTEGRGQRGVASFLFQLGLLFAAEGLIAEAMTALWLPIITAFAADVAADAAEEVAAEPVDLATWAAAYVASHVRYQVGSSYGQIRKITTEAAVDAIADEVLARLGKWQDERPERVARWEKTQLPNAAARETWKAAGVTEVEWVTVGSNCSYCDQLDGRIVRMENPFVAKGDVLDGAKEGEKLTAKRNTFNPPVHVGCDCRVAPVVA